MLNNSNGLYLANIDVSVVDLTIKLEKDVSYDDIVNCIKKYSNYEDYNKIIGWTDESLVSSDLY